MLSSEEFSGFLLKTGRSPVPKRAPCPYCKTVGHHHAKDCPGA